MQVQDYLPFIQNMAQEYYQFTLENPVYAGCLAITVWLLTAMFYSLRIGSLKRTIQANLKSIQDAQNGLTAAQEEIQKLQDEISASRAQVEQETQRSGELQERIAGLSGQLKERILGLAADPNLGQQGLSVTDDLEAEHLWQRFSAAVSHLTEALVAERKNNSELQQAYNAETAKLVEKDAQLQIMQTRLDSQNQRLAKLETTVEEQKIQLVQQQETAQQYLANLEAKHQIDFARSNVSETQTRESEQVSPSQAKSEAPTVPPVQSEHAEVSVSAPSVLTEPEAQRVDLESKSTMRESVTPEPTIVRAKTVEQNQVVHDAEVAASGIAGKFKSIFASAKQQIEKMDDMFGLSTPMLEPQERVSSNRVEPESRDVVVEVTASEPEEVTVPEPQPVISAKQPSGGLSATFKKLFPSSKASPADSAKGDEKTVESVPSEPEQSPSKMSDANSSGTSGKLKNLFGKFKRNA